MPMQIFFIFLLCIFVSGLVAVLGGLLYITIWPISERGICEGENSTVRDEGIPFRRLDEDYRPENDSFSLSGVTLYGSEAGR